MKDIIIRKRKFMIEREWDNLPPADLAKSIMIEAAELLEHFQWKNYTKEEIDHDISKKQAIGQEIADIMIYALDLALTLDLDPEQIIVDKIEKNEKKFPAKVMLEADWYEQYLEIKQQQRNEE